MAFRHRYPPRTTRHVACAWIAGAGLATRALARVLDYGCGSGILAIGAALCGASAVVDAVDIDPAAALAATRLPTQLANRRRTSSSGAAGCRQPAAYASAAANILATPLKSAGPSAVVNRVAPGGAPAAGGHPGAAARRYWHAAPTRPTVLSGPWLDQPRMAGS
jgi:ribosomal protein L11 methyltransferase